MTTIMIPRKYQEVDWTESVAFKQSQHLEDITIAGAPGRVVQRRPTNLALIDRLTDYASDIFYKYGETVLRKKATK